MTVHERYVTSQLHNTYCHLTNSGTFDVCAMFLFTSTDELKAASSLCGWKCSWCSMERGILQDWDSGKVQKWNSHHLNVNEWQQHNTRLRKCQPQGLQNTCQLFHLFPADLCVHNNMCSMCVCEAERQSAVVRGRRWRNFCFCWLADLHVISQVIFLTDIA